MKKKILATLLALVMVLGMLPIAAFAVEGEPTKPALIAAPLGLKDAQGNDIEGSVVTADKYKAVYGDIETAPGEDVDAVVNLSAEGLKATYHGDIVGTDDNGEPWVADLADTQYFAGVGFEKSNGTNYWMAASKTTDFSNASFQGPWPDSMTSVEDDKTYANFYFAVKTLPKKGSFYVGIKTSADGGVTVYQINYDLKGTATAGTAYDENDVQAANLTYSDAEGAVAPIYGHAKTYKVASYDSTNRVITISATGLQKTVNSEDQDAYWVGLALKQPTGDGATNQYAWGYGDRAAAGELDEDAYEAADSFQGVDGQSGTFDTIYWGFPSVNSIKNNPTGWLSVKGEGNKVVDYSVIFDITVDGVSEAEAEVKDGKVDLTEEDVSNLVNAAIASKVSDSSVVEDVTAPVTAPVVTITATKGESAEALTEAAVDVPVAALTAAKDGEVSVALEVEGVGSMTLDSTAIGVAVGEETEGTLTLKVATVANTANLENELPAAVTEENTLGAFTASVQNDEGDITITDAGEITLVFQVSGMTADSEIVVYQDGQALTTGVTPGAGKVTVVTNHLSEFVIVDKTALTVDTPTVIKAPIVHNPEATGSNAGSNQVTTGLGDVNVSTPAKVDDALNTYSLTLTGNNIVAHKNAKGVEGYWVGFGMEIEGPSGTGYTYQCKKGDGAFEDVTGAPGRVISSGTGSDTKYYNTIYFDEAGTYTVTQTKNGVTVTYIVTVVIDKATPTGVTVVPAPLADHASTNPKPVDELGTVAVEIAANATANTYNVTVIGNEIVSHENADHTSGTWVGFGMPVTTAGAYTYTNRTGGAGTEITSVKNRVIEDSAGNKYETIYFDTAGDYIIEQKANDNSVTRTYNVKVIINEKIEPVTVVAAPLADHSASPKTDLGTITLSEVVGTKTAAGNTYTFTLTGNNIVRHKNANDDEGPWVGFGMPIDGTSSYTYKNKTNNADATLSSVAGRIIEVDSAKYNTVYFDEPGTYTIEQKKGSEAAVYYVVTVVINEKFSGGGSTGGGAGEPEKPVFTDVPADAYYADAVAWAVEKGITEGRTPTTFVPNGLCTRAEIVTFLWRAAGSPKATGSNPFTDVSSSAYYYDAVLWAVANKITVGTTDTTFSPSDTCTRAQAVTFLHRYEKEPAGTGSNKFTDVAAGQYYANAVQWAVNKGVTVGTTDTTFSPANTCTRGQIVTFLYRDMAK